MAELIDQHRNYEKVAKAITYLASEQAQQPNLKALAAHVNLSEFHLQRVFTQWAGVSPKQFLQFLTKQKAKTLLKDHSVINASYESGLSSGGRLHDLMVHCESVTPGEYKSGGKGIHIEYGIHPSPFGLCLIGITRRGLCKLSFFDGPEFQNEVIEELKNEWPNATIEENELKTQAFVDAIFSDHSESNTSIKVLCKGTPFQLQVWEALLKIPEGQLSSYQQVADSIGRPSATRAVASAIARNHIAYLIPCHRVIRNSGEINQYRWGAERKQAIIARECCTDET